MPRFTRLRQGGKTGGGALIYKGGKDQMKLRRNRAEAGLFRPLEFLTITQTYTGKEGRNR